LCLQRRCSTAWATTPVHLLWLFWRWGSHELSALAGFASRPFCSLPLSS
jgi:hypothetical protein